MNEDRQIESSGVTFSFVAPVYNEEACLAEFHARLREVAERLGEPYEIIFVNDGSADGSLEVIRDLAKSDQHVKYVDLSRNFGHQEALTAGYDFARGQAVVTIDADCQHPPDMIPTLVDKWRQGYEVVYTIRTETANQGPFKRITSRVFYGLLEWLSGLDVADRADFRLLDRKAVDALCSVREKGRFLRGMVSWIGFHQVGVPYQAAQRHAGQTGYSFKKMARLAGAGIFNFSLAPLRLILSAGLALMAVAVLCALATTGPVAHLTAWVIGLTGLQLAALGLVGEYIGRTFDEVKNRPLYIVRQAAGFELPKEEQSQPAGGEVVPPRPQAQSARIRLFT
jgi:dolichol-phosphate mannosyltransferase